MVFKGVELFGSALGMNREKRVGYLPHLYARCDALLRVMSVIALLELNWDTACRSSGHVG